MASADVSLVLQPVKLVRPLKGLSDKEPPSGETDRKLALLSSLGLDVKYLMGRAPHILSCSFNKLFAVSDYLKEQGLDSRRIVQSTPSVLGQRPEALQTRLQFFAENGLDVLKHVNGMPA
eukprot:EG_transcript_51012